MHSYLSTHLLGYVHTDHHASSLPKNKYLPVTTTTCVPAHRCTRSWPYLFICIQSFWEPFKVYLSTFLLFYMSKVAPVHHSTCSVCFFFFGITCAMTFQLVYWGTYTQIHPKIYLSVYLHASLPSNHKGLSVTTITCVHAHICTRSWPYVFISLSFRLTVKIYPFMVLLFYMSTDVSVHQYTCSVASSFSALPAQWPFNSSAGVLTHRSTRKYIYLFTFMLFFRLTTKTYLSPQLLVYMHIDVPVHDPTCSSSYCQTD